MRRLNTLNCLRPLEVLIFGLLCAVLINLPNPVLADDGDKDPKKEKITYRITGDVYFGDKNRFSKPCVLDRDKVFAKIPAFQKIKREGLDKSSARYYFLLEEANRVFRAKVKEVAKEKKYDLVVEKDEIKASKNVKIPDITRAVIKAIEK